VLLNVTADARYSRSFDLFGELRSTWDRQRRERERLFTHIIPAGFPQQREAPPWDEALARLRELASRSTKGAA
jgi:hypothetical protein